MNSESYKLPLLNWYRANKRELPWRLNRDPYRIWISETMLQQTTTTAVIPYFERFVSQFSTLNDLANADEGEVLEVWSGLGYYSRARNLHRAARELAELPEFPKTHLELAKFPGFGPYTARAVASLAFDESVGVVDGNTIRVLSRWSAEAWEWWRPAIRKEIQTRVDQWVRGVSSYEMNQALMELGRTICTPKSPSCLLCPLRTGCRAFQKGRPAEFPRSKPKRAREIWIWQPRLAIRSGRVFLTQDQNLPFLKTSWMPPGEARQVARKPREFDYKHTITHHDIYVTVSRIDPKIQQNAGQWIHLKELPRYAPASLVQKALQISMASDSGGNSHARGVRTRAAQKPRSRTAR